MHFTNTRRNPLRAPQLTKHHTGCALSPVWELQLLITNLKNQDSNSYHAPCYLINNCNPIAEMRNVWQGTCKSQRSELQSRRNLLNRATPELRCAQAQAQDAVEEELSRWMDVQWMDV